MHLLSFANSTRNVAISAAADLTVSASSKSYTMQCGGIRI